MKTWEMIKELIENPSKEFVSEDDLNGKMTARLCSSCIEFIKEGSRIKVTRIHPKREWEEIKKPVSFIEAVESGKKIRIEHEILTEEVFKSFHVPDELLHGITGMYHAGTISEIILNGKWYIE